MTRSRLISSPNCYPRSPPCSCRLLCFPKPGTRGALLLPSSMPISQEVLLRIDPFPSTSSARVPATAQDELTDLSSPLSLSIRPAPEPRPCLPNISLTCRSPGPRPAFLPVRWGSGVSVCVRLARRQALSLPLQSSHPLPESPPRCERWTRSLHDPSLLAHPPSVIGTITRRKVPPHCV